MVTGGRKIIVLGVEAQDSLFLLSLSASEHPFRSGITLRTMETWIWSKKVLWPRSAYSFISGWSFRHKAWLRDKHHLLEWLLQPRMGSSPSPGQQFPHRSQRKTGAQQITADPAQKHLGGWLTWGHNVVAGYSLAHTISHCRLQGKKKKRSWGILIWQLFKRMVSNCCFED